jgi:hypothetical protein
MPITIQTFGDLLVIPNITYGKDVADKTLTRDKIQYKHVCLSYAFKSLRKVSKEKGIDTVVLGCNIHWNVWIHLLKTLKAITNGWVSTLATEKV